MSLGKFVSEAWHHVQGELFPFLAEEVGPLGEIRRRFVAVPDLTPVGRHLHYDHRGVGHPPADRNALARAFVAKAVWDLPTAAALIDRLRYDPTLRRLCGWCRVSEVPSASTFSRAFAWFAETRLPERMHGALVRAAHDGSVVGHMSRDSTAIVGRERPVPKPKREPKPKRRRGRPRRGEEAVREPTRLERQLKGGLSTERMVAELPKACDVGTKRNAKGVQRELERVQAPYRRRRRRHPRQLHPDVRVAPRQPGRDPAGEDDRGADPSLLRADGRRLRFMGDRRPRLPGGARGDHRRQPLPRRGDGGAQRRAGHVRHDRVRCRQRSSVERVNSALKDSYGGRHVRVRGHAKVACHLFFGVLALTVHRLMRLIV